MKKFKVKNRQKRKYTKRITVHTSSHFSLLRPSILGIVPMFIIGVSFFVTYMIINKPIDPSFTPQVSINLPAIRIPEIKLDIKQIAFIPPKIKFSPQPINITPPRIDVTPVGKSLSYIHRLLLTGFSLTISLITNMFQGTVAIITLLNPIPLMMKAYIHMITVEIRFIQFTTFKITQVCTSILSFDVFIMQYIVATVQKIFYLTYQTVLTTVQGTLSFIFFIQQLLIQFGKATWVFLNAVGIKIMEISNAIGNLILTPFRIMGEYYQHIKPYLDFIGTHINKSFGNMSEGFSNLTTLPTEIIEPSQKK